MSTYTFYYCLDHDDGCLAKGDIIPAGFNLCCCHTCDWQYMGTITYDGTTVEISQPIDISYEKYAGGFKFIYYASACLDEVGNCYPIPTDSPLYKWFETMSISDVKIAYPPVDQNEAKRDAMSRFPRI